MNTSEAKSKISLCPDPSTPLASLQAGVWFKLICGASYQDLPAVRNLTLAYALAGADCIDVAADPAVVAAAKAGLAAAEQIASSPNQPYSYRRPWLMVSMSTGADPHFRKAWFDPAKCPADCPRPCEQICPAAAIAFDGKSSGVIRDRCYGCGRCLPICPLGLIEARSYPTTLDAIAQRVLSQADALEIHTQVGQQAAFESLWQTLSPQMDHLQLVSISCPDGEGLIAYLTKLQRLICSTPTRPTLIWQTDGRPMSGDIGRGTTHAAIRLAQKVLSSGLTGYVQLAGGTNQYTALKLNELGLLNPPQADCRTGLATRQTVAGIAYGSFARHLLMSVIEQTLYLEEDPHTLWKAVELAESLVGPLKAVMSSG